MATRLAYLPGSALRPNYVIRNSGFRWIVKTVTYDIRGNMGSNTKPHPRYCVSAIPADAAAWALPSPYHDMSMGLGTELDWCVEVDNSGE